jgi:hypothetical protein
MKLEVFIRYLEEHEGEIERGDPFVIPVVDRENFEQKVVKAIVAKPPKALPGGNDLWIKNYREELDPVPWKIKVLEEVGGLFATGKLGID